MGDDFDNEQIISILFPNVREEIYVSPCRESSNICLFWTQYVLKP